MTGGLARDKVKVLGVLAFEMGANGLIGCSLEDGIKELEQHSKCTEQARRQKSIGVSWRVSQLWITGSQAWIS